MSKSKIHSGYHAFKTDLGWMGLAWSNDCLDRLTFGHTTERSVASRVPEGSTLTSRVPAEYRDLVQQLRQYASGDFVDFSGVEIDDANFCLLYTSPSPRDKRQSRMPSSA